MLFAIGHEAIAHVLCRPATQADLRPRLATINPDEAVMLLNQAFSTLDEMAERDGLGKIKRRGDASMAASAQRAPRIGLHYAIQGDSVHAARP
jgi:hypothetical protein